MTQALRDLLVVLIAVGEVGVARGGFVFLRRLERRRPAPLGEQVGAHKAVLAKVRKRQPLSAEEMEYATELVTDVRSPLAYCVPAAIFTLGLFYVVGCLQQLHGSSPSFRTLIGFIPMLTSTNMAIQISRVARLKGRLREAPEAFPQFVSA